jgi:chromate reductase
MQHGLVWCHVGAEEGQFMTTHSVAVIVGSLRKQSFSLRIAQAMAKLAPASLKLNVVTLNDLSFFNQDLEANPPADWVKFRETVQASDAVIFVAPEYNRSVSGVLKNAIDVGSRPYGKSSFLGKPTGIVASSPGPIGGLGAALSLRQTLPGITGPILPQPEIYLNAIADAFDENGEIVKESIRPVLQAYIYAFAAWVALHKK